MPACSQIAAINLVVAFSGLQAATLFVANAPKNWLHQWAWDWDYQIFFLLHVILNKEETCISTFCPGMCWCSWRKKLGTLVQPVRKICPEPPYYY